MRLTQGRALGGDLHPETLWRGLWEKCLWAVSGLSVQAAAAHPVPSPQLHPGDLSPGLMVSLWVFKRGTYVLLFLFPFCYQGSLL